MSPVVSMTMGNGSYYNNGTSPFDEMVVVGNSDVLLVAFAVLFLCICCALGSIALDDISDWKSWQPTPGSAMAANVAYMVLLGLLVGLSVYLRFAGELSNNFNADFLQVRAIDVENAPSFTSALPAPNSRALECVCAAADSSDRTITVRKSRAPISPKNNAHGSTSLLW